MHHGGAFSKQDELTYDGGDIALFQKIDKDEMSYYHLVQLAKSVGFKDGDNLYYAIPGHSLGEGGIDHLKDDASVYEMMKYANQAKFLEVYIQHNEHDVSGYPAVGDAAEQDNTVETNKSSKPIRLRKKRDKRLWTAEEENVLTDVLYEMNDSGWKVDTGHKSGYLTFIEKELAKRLPNANIKADPHIQSKVKTLKKLLSYILDIQQSGSGFGWDEERKMVVGDKEQFMGWAKSRPGAAALYGKPFVNFDKLFEIYASDLAKGAKAKGPGDQFEVHEELSSADVTESTQQFDSAVYSHSQPACHGSNSSSGVKSLADRKRVLLDDGVFASEFSNISKALNTLVEAETTNAAAINAMQSAFTQELEAQKRTAERREQLFSVLRKLSGFSRDQIVKAALVIGQNEKCLNLFFTTPDELKSEFVHQVLKRSKKISK
ncbi:unnamed protein product [Urochloa humidicola]